MTNLLLYYSLIAVAVLLWAAIMSHSAPESDWATVCDPQLCRCKWVSGQKLADCTNSNLSFLPKNLSNEVQVLELSNNRITDLKKESFLKVGLINLHKIIARSCSIERVDKDAFSGLEILIELDLSDNEIHVLHPATFRVPFRLRKIYLNNNPIQTLQNGLFSNMSFLQTVEFNKCMITKIEPKTFFNVTKFNSLELSGNKLSNIKPEVLNSVPSLMNLEITNNPWRCDCKLRPFRDLVMEKNLYIKTASCTEPPRLLNKLWGNIKPDDFACQPIIQYPAQSSTFVLDDDDLTIGCKIYGEPMPNVQWVFNNRPISNYSHGDYKFTVYESVDNTMAKWINLTMSRSRLTGNSEFKCIAQNAAGLEERKITVSVQSYSGKGILGSTVSVKESLPIIIGLVAGIFIIILLLIVCCLCCCRRRPINVPSKKSHTNGFSNGDVPNHNHVTSLVSEPSEQQKSLLAVVNPVQKPPRRYESSPTGTEMTELKRNLLDETSISGDAEEQCYGGESGDELASIEGSVLGVGDCSFGEVGGGGVGGNGSRSYRKGAHPPDLLAFPRGGAGGHSSPANSVASSMPFQSPLHSPVYSGTLPYNRSQSPFNSRPALPPTGYVTIPRRPRVPSWASSSCTVGAASTPTGGHPLDDPLGIGRLCEPVYDNLGPRTTADGSSVLSLTKAVADSGGGLHRPTPQYSQTLPHKTKLLHNNNGGVRLRFDSPDRVPSPAPRSPPEKTISSSAVHNALPPNYSPLVEMDARNRSSWAPSRVGTPETGVLKPASQTSVKRKVPPKPPPKPKIKGGPLFEDEGEDGTEV